MPWGRQIASTELPTNSHTYSSEFAYHPDVATCPCLHALHFAAIIQTPMNKIYTHAAFLVI